ncbi:hypothetical protein F4553_007076 [Allocatelliglobosispora scoriae]|uniref:Uncharacterized protein n=1 Tax=Allocatelliglobosispora scoriae TaxID=643052 RepID=A0A841C3K8_9ACTN|nr:hypothetical protein [Allocatelliglobosispora scoriae]
MQARDPSYSYSVADLHAHRRRAAHHVFTG